MKKILVLYSEKEHPIEQRIDLLKIDHRLDNYHINYQYLIDFLLEGNATYAKRKFEAVIEKFQPDIILIHVGIVMHKAPDFFIYLFNKLRLEYPNIVFGMDRDDLFFKSLDKNFYDNSKCSDEIELLIEIIF